MYKLVINFDKKCRRCGGKGATPGGLCLNCITKDIKAGKHDDMIRKAREKIEREKEANK